MIAQGGTVYEVVGHAGTGKTQLCLTAVAECLVAGGRVAYIDTKAGLDICSRSMENILLKKIKNLIRIHDYLLCL